VAFYDKPLLKFERLLETYVAFAPVGIRSFFMSMPVWLREKLMMRRMIRNGLAGMPSAPLFVHGSPRKSCCQRVLPESF
jgi:hypothetical protein